MEQLVQRARGEEGDSGAEGNILCQEPKIPMYADEIIWSQEHDQVSTAEGSTIWKLKIELGWKYCFSFIPE